MKKPRLRFAPSPTGALHIGGIRTALYNYLLAKKHGGAFILRIEDTDQQRYVPGAEEYIIEALRWCGLYPEEGPGIGGAFAPYRQSERQAYYRQYAQILVDKGHAYYAFDTPEELDTYREREKEKGNHNFKYDASVRMDLRNSLSLPHAETAKLLAGGHPYTIRLKVPGGERISVQDRIRGEVIFASEELDDKVMLKADGMPTYHLANIVDDHLMEITHVIRGEEWLPSTAHHVLLYRFLGWEDTMPEFAHLPLILKPNGKGKLSKRDGAKLGIPVFPLSWESDNPEDAFIGFREYGFLPQAVINFLAFLGWNPGTEQEIFSLAELTEAFTVDKIGKSGARFDFDKALWYNQQYIIATDNATLATMVRPIIEAHGHQPAPAFLEEFCGLMKERVVLLPEFWTNGYYFFEPVRNFDLDSISKRWSAEKRPVFDDFLGAIGNLPAFEAPVIEAAVKQFINEQGLKFGDVLPVLRIAISGTMKGPAAFEMMALLGKAEVLERMKRAYALFDAQTVG